MLSRPSEQGAQSTYFLRRAALVLLSFLLFWGCHTVEEEYQGYLQGQITVRSDLSATGSYDEFRVLVLEAEGRSIDTLACADTDENGHFATTVTAPERGIYTLSVWGRPGNDQLVSTEYVVADGDSTTFNLTLPLDRQRLRLNSQENAALDAYRNILALHRNALVNELRTDLTDSEPTRRRIRQTSSMLWRLRETFPGTYASQLAAAGSLSLLASRADSLLLERVHSIEPSNPRYVEAVQIGRRAAARLQGQSATLDFLDTFEARATSDAQRAGVQAARVQLFIDSLQSEAALSAAATLRRDYPHTRWAEWANRVSYELKNLRPGLPAPTLRARTVAGDSLSLQSLRGHPVLLEYYAPGDDLYGRQLATRNALYEATRPDSVTFVSVSVQPDTVVYRAFLSDRSLPGYSVIASGGRRDPIVRAYNVVGVPTRFLIDRDGRIVGRYSRGEFLALQEDLVRVVNGTLQGRGK